MAEPLLSDAELVRRLGAHPELRSRMESLVLAVEDETGELKTADAAEMRVIEEMRRTGQVTLQSWATRQVQKTSQELKQSAGVWSEGKKTLLAQVAGEGALTYQIEQIETPVPVRAPCLP